MRRAIIATALALAVAIAVSAPVTAQIPEGFKDVVVLGAEGVRLDRATVTEGDVIGNLAGATILLDQGAAVAGDVKGDTLDLRKSASVSGTIFYNALIQASGATVGGTSTPLALPVFGSLPAFQQAVDRPGVADVVVGPNETVLLPAGDYGDVTIDMGGTLQLAGGLYNVRSIAGVATLAGQCVDPCQSLLFAGPTDLRVVGDFRLDKNGLVGPADNSTAAPSHIVYVGGEVYFGQSSDVAGTFYAASGTFHIERESSITGAVIARIADIDRETTVDLSTHFNPAPTAFPQSVTTTNGSVVITLTGSDPDEEPLSFTVVDGPFEGNLDAPPGGAVPAVGGVSEIQLTYTCTVCDPDSFVFRVTDPNGGFDEATVAINTPDSGGGDPPVVGIIAQDGFVETADGVAVEIALLANAPVPPDPNAIGDLSFAIVSPPSPGSVTPPVAVVPDEGPVRSATTTYTPGGLGVDSFVFEACEVALPTNCAQGTITVSVLQAAPPVPPVANDQTLALEVDTSILIDLLGGSADGQPEGDDGRPSGN